MNNGRLEAVSFPENAQEGDVAVIDNARGYALVLNSCYGTPSAQIFAYRIDLATGQNDPIYETGLDYILCPDGNTFSDETVGNFHFYSFKADIRCSNEPNSKCANESVGTLEFSIERNEIRNSISSPELTGLTKTCRTETIMPLARAALKEKAAGITFGYLCEPYIQTGLGLHAHAGIDLKVAEGTPVYAIASGVVVSVDRQNLGKLMIKLPNEKKLIYLHLSRIDVHEGQSVSFGEPLGLSGSKGADSPHLHIEVRSNYSGKFALGGESCEGGECNAAQVAKKTVDPASVVSH